MKIQNGEKAAMSGLDYVRSMEQNLRMRKARTVELQPQSDQAQTMGQSACQKKGQQQVVDFGYGNFDPRMTEHQYLNSLRNLPPPWKNGVKEPKQESSTNSQSSPISLLPSSCLVAYYESRRRWIFGGTGLSDSCVSAVILLTSSFSHHALHFCHVQVSPREDFMLKASTMTARTPITTAQARIWMTNRSSPWLAVERCVRMKPVYIKWVILKRGLASPKNHSSITVAVAQQEHLLQQDQMAPQTGA